MNSPFCEGQPIRHDKGYGCPEYGVVALWEAATPERILVDVRNERTHSAGTFDELRWLKIDRLTAIERLPL